MYITCEADLRKAQIALNSLIETVNSYGGKVFLTEKDNPDFCVKLDKPISISYYALLSGEQPISTVSV